MSLKPESAATRSAPTPSASLLANLRTELARYMPFSQMRAADLDFFLTRSVQQYFAPGEVLVEPADLVVEQLYFIRQGAVSGERGMAALSGGAFQYEAGELFPVSAAVAQRAVTATYRATADTFVLALHCTAMHELAARSPVFSDFLNRRILKFLDLSRQAVQASYASQTLAEQSLETPLRDMITRSPVTCRAETPLREAMAVMHQRRIGSILVVDPSGVPSGILTRYDILGRVSLAGVPLEAPIAQVMVHPVHSLTQEHTAQDAALLMSRHGVRHLPVTRDGVAVGIVSERDLFSMQKLSLKQVSTALRSAADVAGLQTLALDIRRFARGLLAQGVQARQLTALISHLNDVLTERLLGIKAREHGLALHRVCWLALGSEGRSEQTIATDQDNALILPDDVSPVQRSQYLAFAQDVNSALDQCGYPLCSGGIMAGNPQCCLTLAQWRARFSRWIEHGAPQDLLDASIYFDFRCLEGDAAMAQALRTEVAVAARAVPRFLKQLAANALSRTVPLGWAGGIALDGEGRIDLKLQGTAIFVDAARLFALAQGVVATSTRDRFIACGPLLGLGSPEYEAWASGFEFLQMLRLRAQLEAVPGPGNANRVDVAMLNDIDRRILKETFRVGRSMQQRLQLDYGV